MELGFYITSIFGGVLVGMAFKLGHKKGLLQEKNLLKDYELKNARLRNEIRTLTVQAKTLAGSVRASKNALIFTYEDGNQYTSTEITEKDRQMVRAGSLTIIRQSDSCQFDENGNWKELLKWKR